MFVQATLDKKNLYKVKISSNIGKYQKTWIYAFAQFFSATPNFYSGKNKECFLFSYCLI